MDMNDEQFVELKKFLGEYHIAQNKKHQELADQITVLTRTVKPISDVYQAFKGFGKVAMGFFQWVIVPISVIVGIIFSIDKLFHK